jgi:hypothetical protein
VKRPRKRQSSVAVIDIGSNSVRLVVYETMMRSLVTLFNEKTLCGLGREVQTTGLLAPDAVAKALTSLRRFRALCRVMKVGRVYAIATAACRDATNGPDFIAKPTHLRRTHRNPVGSARSEMSRSASYPVFTSRTVSSAISTAAARIDRRAGQPRS